MPTKLKHSIEKALKEFELIGGAGAESDKEACAMTLLAFVCGEAWTDHPPCAHPIIAENVIAANDAGTTTPAMRRRLVKAGETGVLDTWWIPGEVLAWALELKKDQDPDVFARTMRMLTRISKWKENKERPNLDGANLDGANLGRANLGRANLGRANLGRANLGRANLDGANLVGANLVGANLVGANLVGANLVGANLDGANLDGANLGRANLDGANLGRAIGNQFTRLPAYSGWKVADSGLVVKA